MSATKTNTLPDSEQFRDWVRKSLSLLGVSPSPVSKEATGSANLLSKFLNGDTQSLKLSSASKVSVYLQSLADEKGIVLPAFHEGAS